MNDYVDVRGPHPMYIKGVIAIVLPNVTRDVPISIARQMAFSITEYGDIMAVPISLEG